MNCILRGVRVIDPVAHLDSAGQDVWLSDGRIIAIYKHIGEGTLPVIDLTPKPGGQPCVLCPGFIDLHTHLRQAPNADDEHLAENILSGSMAAAAGGFAHIVNMANTDPVIDNPEIVKDSAAFSAPAPIQVLTTAALTRHLDGKELVDIAGCSQAGAVAFSDDGRNAATPRLLSEAIKTTAEFNKPVFIHPEDEEIIAQVNGVTDSVTGCSNRPPAAELKAVDFGIRAINHAGRGRLHFQHVSTAAAVEAIAKAKEAGAAVTAEATPHHLGMWLPFETAPTPPSLAKVNPPLRSERDRNAVVQALREGVIDAVATDHAPHRPESKGDDYEEAAPGFAGLETALAVCLTLGGMGGDWLPVLVDRLTVAPYRVLGDGAGIEEPRLRIGESATCVLFDPAQEWVVGDKPFFSGGKNTPLLGQTLRGRVLMTLFEGSAVYHDTERLPWDAPGGHD
jgi:dihydroorotase